MIIDETAFRPMTNEEIKRMKGESMGNYSMFQKDLEAKVANKESKEDKEELINHPAHYAEGRKYEPIDVINDWDLNFNLGNAIKYISRAGRKDPNAILRDLKKARWYIDYELDRLCEIIIDNEWKITEEEGQRMIKALSENSYIE